MVAISTLPEVANTMTLSYAEQGRINAAVKQAGRYGPYFIQDVMMDLENKYGIEPEKAYKYLHSQGRVVVPWEEYERRQRINEGLT